jgi:hypothetical protein
MIPVPHRKTSRSPELPHPARETGLNLLELREIRPGLRLPANPALRAPVPQPGPPASWSPPSLPRWNPAAIFVGQPAERLGLAQVGAYARNDHAAVTLELLILRRFV